MYVAALTQSLMWKEFNADGNLMYPNFLSTVTQLKIFYILRGIGGTLYLSGVFVMIYNLIKTAKSGRFAPNEDAEAPALLKNHTSGIKEYWHRIWERKPVMFTTLVLIAILIGGSMELIPTFMIKSNVPTLASVKPYTALELQGRDIYIREGCNVCHSQMIRPFRFETERFGEYSKAGEFVYDHPFLWGSKRTGPDLGREGVGILKKPNSWHFRHMIAPGEISTGSIMPAYAWLAQDKLDTSTTAKKIKVMTGFGVPYPKDYYLTANADLMRQANDIVADLKKDEIEVAPDREIIALIAYLQRLGKDIKGDTSSAQYLPKIELKKEEVNE
jgi:cytochrome c oxidase cbb3-type subunit I/II